MNLEIVMAPLITEKGTFVGEKSNQVVFRVRLDASKDRDPRRGRAAFQGHGAQGQDDQADGQEPAARCDQWDAVRIGKKLT